MEDIIAKTEPSKLTIGIDVDGVLADFMGKTRVWLRKFYGKPLPGVVQTSWSFESLGISPEQESALWQVVKDSPAFWFHMDPLPETSRLADLVSRHNVYFVTNRFTTGGDDAAVQTSLWLKDRLGISNAKVVICGDKSVPASRYKFDWFIDDRADNLTAVLKGAPNCRVVLMDQSYNRQWAGAPRVTTFNEFANLILGESND